MIRRPPRSTLFPTRRSSDLLLVDLLEHVLDDLLLMGSRRGVDPVTALLELAALVDQERDIAARSEEHTSELQSPCNLVCRLLLEKNNNSQRPVVLVTRLDTR